MTFQRNSSLIWFFLILFTACLPVKSAPTDQPSDSSFPDFPPMSSSLDESDQIPWPDANLQKSKNDQGTTPDDLPIENPTASASIDQMALLGAQTSEQKLYEFLTFGPLNLLWGTLPENLPQIEVSPSCRSALNLTLDSLHAGRQWAFSLTNSVNLEKLLDSTFLHLADFDRCLALQVNSFNGDTPSTLSWQGQYCVADLRPSSALLHSSTLSNFSTSPEIHGQSLSLLQMQNSSLSVQQKVALLFRFESDLHVKHGFCMPSACSSQDIQQLLQPVIDSHGWTLGAPLNCQVHQTVSQKLHQSPQHTQIAFTVLAAFLGLVALASLIDLLVLHSGSCWFGMLRCMSLRRSCNKLFSTKQNPKQVFGLQVLNSLVIFVAIASHSYLYYIWLDAFIIYDKIFYHLFNAKSLFAQPFVNLFDINTGLLFLIPACNACLKLYKIENLGKLRCFKEILGKLFRMFPLMGILVCMQICMPLFFNGPVANHFFQRDAQHCAQNYQRNLLFINNFIEYDQQCVLHSWTISTEMQMFVLLSILIIPFKRRPAIAKLFTLVMILGSIGAILVICYTRFLPPQFIPMPLDLSLLKERAKLIHFPFYAHIFEYFLPVFVFDMIYTKNTSPLSTNSRRTFTFLLIIAFVTIQFYSFPFMTMDFYGTRLLNSFIVITCKLMLPVFFSWAIYNYSSHTAQQIFDELMLQSLYNKLLKIQIFRKDPNNRNCDYMILSKINDKELETNKTDQLAKIFEPVDQEIIQFQTLSAFKYVFLVYSRIAYSLYLSHHFYLSFGLYTVRSPLSTSIFDVWARGVYDVFFMHLYAVIFYLLIESPLVVLTRYIYRGLCVRFDNAFADLKFAY